MARQVRQSAEEQVSALETELAELRAELAQLEAEAAEARKHAKWNAVPMREDAVMPTRDRISVVEHKLARLKRGAIL